MTDDEYRALAAAAGRHDYTEALLADDDLEDLRAELGDAVTALRATLARAVFWPAHGADGPHVGDLDALVAILAGIDHALASAARLRSVITDRRQAVVRDGGCWERHVDTVRRYRAETRLRMRPPGPVVEVVLPPPVDDMAGAREA